MLEPGDESVSYCMNPLHSHSIFYKKLNLSNLNTLNIRQRLQLVGAEDEQSLSDQTACFAFIDNKKACAAFSCCICLEDINLLDLSSKD